MELEKQYLIFFFTFDPHIFPENHYIPSCLTNYAPPSRPEGQNVGRRGRSVLGAGSAVLQRDGIRRFLIIRLWQAPGAFPLCSPKLGRVRWQGVLHRRLVLGHCALYIVAPNGSGSEMASGMSPVEIVDWVAAGEQRGISRAGVLAFACDTSKICSVGGPFRGQGQDVFGLLSPGGQGSEGAGFFWVPPSL